MTHYTGMGPGTISYYENVAARLDAHLPNMAVQSLQPVYGQVSQAPPLVVPAYASNYHQNVSQPFGYSGVNNDQMGEIGRDFIRNLFR
jgi:hypothetical protein